MLITKNINKHYDLMIKTNGNIVNLIAAFVDNCQHHFIT